jgi:hypothetical protein
VLAGGCAPVVTAAAIPSSSAPTDAAVLALAAADAFALAASPVSGVALETLPPALAPGLFAAAGGAVLEAAVADDGGPEVRVPLPAAPRLGALVSCERAGLAAAWVAAGCAAGLAAELAVEFGAEFSPAESTSENR